MYLLIQKSLGLNTSEFQKKLLGFQGTNGFFPAEAIYRYGGSKGDIGYFGSPYISTAFALMAMKDVGQEFNLQASRIARIVGVL